MASEFRIGLALGGGASRALSHIGIIEGLLAHGIPVDIVTGTSMGAVIGALWSERRDVGATRERIERYLASETFHRSRFEFMRGKDDVEGEGVFFRFSQLARKTYFYWISMARRAFVPEDVARQNFEFLSPGGLIEDLQVPFAAVALDIVSGSEVVLDRGDILQALSATCALPGILPPVERGGQLLVDGGWIDAVPVDPAYALGADFVIAVDVSRRLSEFEVPGNGLDIVFRCDAVTRHALCAEKLRRADIVLSPEVGDVHWADFSRSDVVIGRGRGEVDRRIEEIRRQIRGARLRRFFRGSPNRREVEVLPRGV